MKALAELRDWFETVATGVSLYLTWRWRPRPEGRDVTIKVPPATARAVMPTPTIHLSPALGTSSASMAHMSASDAGTRAVLGATAELDPDFPQF